MIAQRFDALGSRLGGEIQVNSEGYESGNVAGLQSGGFVAIWDDFFTATDARIYDVTGSPVGNAFAVNSNAAFNNDKDIWSLANGGFVVGWLDEASKDIHAQVLDAAGARVGGEFLVNTATAGFQNEPVGAGLTSGGFVIIWTDQQGGADDLDLAVRGQLFDAGGSRIGGNFLINTITASVQAGADVAALPGGGFVVVFQSYNGTYEAHAQIFDASGNKVGTELTASTIGHDVTTCTVTALTWGGFLVGWADYLSGRNGVRAQLFDGEGNKVGSEFQINTVSGDSNSRPDFATLASGQVVAVWTNESGNGPESIGVKSQRLIMPTVGTLAGDSLLGGNGDDSLAGLRGNDVIQGGAGADALDGGPGDDVLDGGTGGDSMWGGKGDDAFYVGDSGDQVFEAAGEGYDTVYTSVSFALASGQSIELLRPIDAALAVSLNLSGNEIAQTIIGNAGSNIVFGGAGNDYIYGNASTDTLYGEDGDDTVFGGTENDVVYGGAGTDVLLGEDGDDTLYGEGGANVLAGGSGDDTLIVTTSGNELNGGAGNDIYVVAGRTDSIVEAANGGIDEVRTTSFIYDLNSANNVEKLMFTDNAQHAGVGNALDNVLVAGTAADELQGRGGNDLIYGGTGSANTLLGGTGDDIYYADASGDTVIEYANEGIDTVSTALSVFYLRENVENLVYTGSGTFSGVGSNDNNTITAGAGADYLNGSDGNDILIGGSGADLTIGGNGADQFRYASGESGYDRILDFTPGVDKIALSNVGFAHTATIAFIATGAPVATSSNSTFLYDVNTGILSYDADGNGAGAAVQLAQLNTGLTLTTGDFIFF